MWRKREKLLDLPTMTHMSTLIVNGKEGKERDGKKKNGPNERTP